jgi:hypothetical protein
MKVQINMIFPFSYFFKTLSSQIYMIPTQDLGKKIAKNTVKIKNEYKKGEKSSQLAKGPF